MVMALAAVGCMYAGPAVAEPDVTPLRPAVEPARSAEPRMDFARFARERGGLGRLRGLRFGRIDGHRREAGRAEAPRRSWASAGEHHDKQGRGGGKCPPRQLYATLMPPHDNCYKSTSDRISST